MHSDLTLSPAAERDAAVVMSNAVKKGGDKKVCFLSFDFQLP